MQAATIAGLTSMVPAAAIRADTSETNSNVTVQPNPSFPEDLNTSDILVETLIDWGATHVFGVVGDGINSIIEAFAAELQSSDVLRCPKHGDIYIGTLSEFLDQALQRQMGNALNEAFKKGDDDAS